MTGAQIARLTYQLNILYASPQTPEVKVKLAELERKLDQQ